MGVIVTEDYTLPSGLVVGSYYASINTNDINTAKRVYRDSLTLQPNAVTYELRSSFTFWISKEARESGKQDLGGETIVIKQDTPFTENVYDILYTKFKEKHPSAVDA